MARPKSIDDETLLESVRATFLELGPSVSTQELAKRAGVSEGTLFKRFGSKLELFQEAMRVPRVEDQPWLEAMLDRAGKGDLEEHIRELALGLGRYIDESLPAMQTIHRHGGLSSEQIRELCGENGPSQLAMPARFREYFQREMELGRMRQANPETLADMFIGAVVRHCHVRLYFGDFIQEDLEPFAARLARDFVFLTAIRSTEEQRRLQAAK
ncbi:MAG: TetR/AcrR family transcriptional regulator [Myxococcales bacterium]|jgi:AcrR family transcriptional regulator|nr:TetR/AcrR family transcriptional regulator [Myxococcales bacterium]